MSATLGRPEYAEMVGMYASLVADFGETLSERASRDLERLAASIESIDRIVDSVADDDERADAWERVLRALDGAPAKDDELDRAAHELRALASARGVLPRVARIMRKEVQVAERMRRTEDAATYVRCALHEGRLGAALTLALVGTSSSDRFRRFFFRLGGPANVIDKLVDVRSDHGAGEVRIRPGPRVYARLVLALVTTVPRVVATHPRFTRILALGARWLVRLALGALL